MGGSPQTFSQGGNPAAYVPTSQGTADTGFQNIASNFYNQYMTGATPAQQYGPNVQSAVDSIFSNPFAAPALNAATGIPGQGNIVGSNLLQGGLNLNAAANTGLPYAGTVLGNAFNPAYGSIVSEIGQNPYFGQAMAGAQQGAGIGTGTAGMASGAVPGLFGAANQTLATGFDPQNALFNRTQQQVLDQSNAINAMSGVASTPYGAGVTGKNLSDFDINWQNNLLGRQAQAGSAAQGLDAAGLNLGSGASSLAGTAGGMPSATFTGQLGNVLSALNAQNNAGNVGAGAFSTLLGGAGGGLSTSGNLGNTGLSTLQSTSAYPYNLANTIGGNQLTALGQGINLGNQQYALPQQVINDLESYLRLGQSGSNNALSGGQMGFNQLASGIGGGISGANALFGGNAILSGANPFAGIGGSTGAGDMGTLSALGGNFGGGGDLAASGGGIGDFLSSALPFASYSA